jgi:hypothetical protein
MTKYEAETNKKYPGIDWFHRPCLVTAKSVIADIINTSWIYSAHWSADWVTDARKDCVQRISDVRKELSDLEKALMMLDDILFKEKEKGG